MAICKAKKTCWQCQAFVTRDSENSFVEFSDPYEECAFGHKKEHSENIYSAEFLTPEEINLRREEIKRGRRRNKKGQNMKIIENEKDVVDRWCRGELTDGLYLNKDGDKYVAIDNSTNNCWTEEFDNKKEAIKWLLNND